METDNVFIAEEGLFWTENLFVWEERHLFSLCFSFCLYPELMTIGLMVLGVGDRFWNGMTETPPPTSLTHFPQKKCATPQPAFYSWSRSHENPHTHIPSSSFIQKTPFYFKPIHLRDHLRYTTNPSQNAAFILAYERGWRGVGGIAGWNRLDWKVCVSLIFLM